eukprot:CAMPEP_0206246560 /NCGR_PEP_ID=MMETSP0047_2-20121206/19330_1 /ASSEMBLY_ACC=CAM_ASM_000192 /TAXON_ID=195065 /ORGANISM="Chroomonas mesostigmatica_cf, Strain CCMP1168" /LENGTH=254 /DNA_ID=CAMNT_0053672003 /DNA_START=153 /DNA_END=916 /DNA_ORIENTATION=-
MSGRKPSTSEGPNPSQAYETQRIESKRAHLPPQQYQEDAKPQKMGRRAAQQMGGALCLHERGVLRRVLHYDGDRLRRHAPLRGSARARGPAPRGGGGRAGVAQLLARRARVPLLAVLADAAAAAVFAEALALAVLADAPPSALFALVLAHVVRADVAAAAVFAVVLILAVLAHLAPAAVPARAPLLPVLTNPRAPALLAPPLRVAVLTERPPTALLAEIALLPMHAVSVPLRLPPILAEGDVLTTFCTCTASAA